MQTDNPYPGPVPLSDPQWLKGRKLHVNRFVDAVGEYRVVQLHGQSGVGKSSFLRAGGVPRLEDYGYTVATVDTWEQVASLGDVGDTRGDSGSAGATSSQSLWLAAVDQALAESAPLYRRSLSRPDEYLERIASIPNLVIVFDQFEELLRADEMQGKTLGTRFLDYAARIADDRQFSVTQVLSLRSEYLSELRPLQEAVPHFKWVEFEVPTVDFAATIPEIIRVDPNVDDATVDKIHRLWNLAAYGRPELAADSRPAIGLLEIQAYLWRMAADSAAGLEDLDRSKSRPNLQAIDSFVDAMEFYVSHRLEEESERYSSQPGNSDDESEQRLRRGRETVVAASLVAPHLSSAGYKLVRDTDDLAVSAIPSIKDLRLQRVAEPDLTGLSDEDRSILSHARSATDSEHGSALRPSAKRNLPNHQAAIEEAARVCRIGSLEEDVARLVALFGRLWRVDMTTEDAYRRAVERLSARMYGGDPVHAVAELVANYERALKWMEKHFIVRLTPTATGGRVTALVHDGFGVPLSRWGRAHEARPSTALSSLVAISGETVIDRSPETPLTPEEMLGGTVERVRWLGCEIQAGFENVTFKECDFRGSIFVGTTFRNVRFIDCNLWGVLFLSCKLDGCRFEGGPPLQTLTIRESTIEGNGVVFTKLPEKSYGLFFDRVEGGPWMIDACRGLSHVSLSGNVPDDPQGNLEPGVIRRSTITHLTFGKQVNPGTRQEDSTIIHVQPEDGLTGDCPPSAAE